MIKRTMINNPATIEMSQFLKTQMKIVDKAAIRNKKNVTCRRYQSRSVFLQHQ
jgi:hypothetical protein